MKKQLSLLVCLMLTASAAVAQTTVAPTPAAPPVLENRQAEPQTWKRYTVSGEHFSVLLPTVPAMTTTVMTLRPLKKTQRERMLGVYADGVVYGIWILENVKQQSLDEFIGQYRPADSIPSSETTVTVNGVNGKQYTSNNTSIRQMTQYFSNEGRLYKFTAGGDLVTDDVAKQFFSSIVLGKKVDGMEVADGIGQPFEGAAGEPAVTGKEVNRKARLFQKPEPRYTEDARQAQITGTVVIKAVFSSSGSVTNIRVVSSLSHGLTERAIDAARKIKFTPAIKDGKYASMWMQLEYNFNLY